MEITCPECASERSDLGRVCGRCGAPPLPDHRHGDRGNDAANAVRTTDLEPYMALRYIARLFKVLAVLMGVMLIGEVIAGFMTQGRAAIITLLGESTRLLVMGGVMWGLGDLAILLIDVGHDLRVSRILLGRINAEVHHGKSLTPETNAVAMPEPLRIAVDRP